MATITLTGGTFGCTMGMGVFEGIGVAFTSAKGSSSGLNKALGTLKSKIDLASVAAKVETSQEQTQKAEEREFAKKSSLSLAYEKLNTLIADTGLVDMKASSKIRERKDAFYDRYNYLKPECEKTKKEKRKERRAERWQNFKDFCSGVGNAIKNLVSNVIEWCNSNIGKIVLGVVAVVGAILIIVAVVASGGLALVPLLTAWGLSAGVATAISLTVATVAVVSTSLALIPNSIDLAAAIDEVVDPENNKISDFNKFLHSSDAYNNFQTTMNITSAISGGVYSIGSMYNASKGITNADLKQFNALQSEGYRPGFGSYGQEVNYLSDFYPGSDSGINRSLGQAEFYSVTNSNGGQIHVSTAPIDQYSFTDIVTNAKGQVNILSGTHGDIDGMLLAERQFLMEDIANWGNYSNVAVFDVTKLSTAEVSTILNSNSTSICAWCYSERSVTVLKALGLM